MVPGALLHLAIDKPAAGGRMIARTDGRVVLVSGAIPGERVQARVERIGRGVVYARTVAVEEPSPDRRPTMGDPLCGGCLYSHIQYPRQIALKGIVIGDAFARIGGIELPAPVDVAPSPEEGYRMRARLHVRGTRLGYFREGTHELCDVRQTRQLLPATADLLDRFSEALRSLALDRVRELELAENLDASERVVHVEVEPSLDSRTLAVLAATEGLTGISSPGRGHGELRVTDRIRVDGHAAVSLRRHVQAFFQGNRYLLERLVSHVVARIDPGAEVIDLYAGVGLFAVAAAAARAARVVAVEGDRIAAADLAANAATSGAVLARHESVEAFVHRAKERTPGATLIVDPPRTGVSREAVEDICRLGASRIVYVSCDVATLARDARRIVDSGYRIADVSGFDLFPNTPHVETVVVFDRDTVTPQVAPA